LKKALFVVFLCLTVAACQKANNIVVDSSNRIINATGLVFVGSDSIDIASSINVHPPHLLIQDSFMVVLDSVDGFSYLDVKVENDSGTVLTEQSFASPRGNSVAGSFHFIPSSVYVGDLSYTFTPYNVDGAAGDYEVKTVHLFNSSTSPPVVDTVIAPDSIQVNEANTVLFSIYAKVTDPFGLSDLEIVYFNTKQPNGVPSQYNPYHMFDDGGASGDITDNDLIANDGTFSFEGQLPPSTTTGTYTFTFYAVNRSGVTSIPVIHKITVY